MLHSIRNCFPGRGFGAEWFAALTVFWSAAHATAALAPPNVVVGNVRVQLLSDSLLRMELKGPAGFEDRATFHIVNRDWPGTAFAVKTNADDVEVQTADYVVAIPSRTGGTATLDGVRVRSADGQTLYQYDGKLENSQWLPGPAEKPEAWWFADTPRIVPPPWGLTPPPRTPDASSQPPNGGWDLSNDAPDVYVFVPRGNYFTLRKDFLKLTGPTEMPPLYEFGAFDSRWYDYSEATALKQIDDYRAHRIPLDVLVVDTGWRAGASTGYQPNTNLFPNLPRFFREAHAKNVRVLFNDHPEPLSTNVTGLDAKELNYRFNGLAGLLNDGLDIWWYDRNWWVALVPPEPNLRKEVWGMRLYHDTTARVRPNQRPLIMANVDGIDNGLRKRPMDVAAHRFPFQWTGDIGPGYDFLRRAVENAVYSGVQSLFPYESDDLGGHVANPTPEQYIRWIEYGALSPVYRPHCTHNLERMPWAFGPEAEKVARRFVNMRYRLLPVFYAAAHENYETGEPILRRLDLDYVNYPNYPDVYPEASRNDEYTLGKNILVAPVLQGSMQIVPGTWLKTPDGQPGLQAEFFTNEDLSGAPAFTRTDAVVDFDWSKRSPARDFPRTHFSARWNGTIEVPASVGDVKLATLEDDGARVWIDGQLVIDAWGGHDSATSEATTVLTAGAAHQIRVEYLQMEYNALIKLQWHSVKSSLAGRAAWIPPGNWIDAWTGATISGPAGVTNHVPLDQMPIYIRSGAVLPLAPEMQYTGEKPWNPITLDLYPHTNEVNGEDLYEDDTQTTAYQHGEFRKTDIWLTDDETEKIAVVRVEITAAKGTFHSALKNRAWTLRIHPPVDWPKDLVPSEVRVNDEKINAQIHRLNRDAAAMPFGDPSGAPDTDVFEITLPDAPVARSQSVEISFAPPNR
ncbi:MAG TPA: TIM-barrel domain-containing protein [Verrucomicrobiae bacterium]|nr:TIM-barrel domain-containing protein [Verrucomicrobiae bacterium]